MNFAFVLIHLLEPLDEALTHPEHLRIFPLDEIIPWGKFLKVVIAKFSERVQTTKDNTCLLAGRKRFPPTR